MTKMLFCAKQSATARALVEEATTKSVAARQLYFTAVIPAV